MKKDILIKKWENLNYTTLKDYSDEVFLINYGKSKEQVKELRKFLSVSNDIDLKYVFSVSCNDLFEYVSICNCGNCETHMIKPTKCSFCNAELNDISDYELKINDNANFSEVIQFSTDFKKGLTIGDDILREDEHRLLFNINQYSVSLFKDGLEFRASNILTNEIIKSNSKIEIESSYNPVNDSYPDGLGNSYFKECVDSEKYFGLVPNYIELLEELYDFMPDFKLFIEGHSIDLKDSINEELLDIEQIIKAVQLFINCANLREINEINSVLLNNLMTLNGGYYSNSNLKDSLDIVNNNYNKLRNSEFKHFTLFDDIKSFFHSLDFLIDLNNNELEEYLIHFSGEDFKKNIVDLNTLYSSLEHISFKDYIYYIVRGANNENLLISSVISNINHLILKGYEVSFKGAFKINDYNKFVKLDEISDLEVRDNFLKASECKNFDEIYKLFVN